MYNSVKDVKGILLSNEYAHIAFPGWNSNPDSLSKNNGGTDPNKAMNHTVAMYIRVRFFLKRTIYLFDLTMRKYRLIAIIPMVLREAIPKMNTPKAKNSQKVSPSTHWPRNRVTTVKGEQQVDNRMSLTANAITNMLGSVRSLWFLYTA